MKMIVNKKNLFWILVLWLPFLGGCHENDSPLEERCLPIVIDKSLFLNSHGDDFDFEKISLVGDCLEISIRYAGGCGDIIATMVDSGDIDDSILFKRNLRLVIEDNDPCEASITKTLSYDLMGIQVAEINEIRLEISGWPNPIIYKY